MPNVQENETLHIIMQSTHAQKEKPAIPRQENKYSPQQQFQQTRRVRLIQEEEQEEEEEEEEEEDEQEEETVDGEAALYVKVLMEDWSSINVVRPTGFREIKNVSLNKDISGEFWLKTKKIGIRKSNG